MQYPSIFYIFVDVLCPFEVEVQVCQDLDQHAVEVEVLLELVCQGL